MTSRCTITPSNACSRRGRDDQRGMVRSRHGGAGGAEPLPAIGVLQAVCRRRVDEGPGLDSPRPALLAHRLVPPDLQRHPLPLLEPRGPQRLRAPSGSSKTSATSRARSAARPITTSCIAGSATTYPRRVYDAITPIPEVAAIIDY